MSKTKQSTAQIANNQGFYIDNGSLKKLVLHAASSDQRRIMTHHDSKF